MATWQNFGFQNFSSWTSSNLESLHDLVLVWLIIITAVVLSFSFLVLTKSNVVSLGMDSATLEVVWTVLPILILLSIASPSIFLLCLQETCSFTVFNAVKLTSNQWNWQSEQTSLVDHLLDFNSVDKLSSYENPLLLKQGVVSRLSLTSSDVLHSLGLPCMGVKLDSNPGRVNAILVEPLSLGLLSGSCYELCGSGHSAMPLSFLVV